MRCGGCGWARFGLGVRWVYVEAWRISVRLRQVGGRRDSVLHRMCR